MRFHYELDDNTIHYVDLEFGSCIRGMRYKNQRPTYVTIYAQEIEDTHLSKEQLAYYLRSYVYPSLDPRSSAKMYIDVRDKSLHD